MSAAELAYGIAPVPDASVTYQPDVVVVGGGANSVRSQSSNGFIWTIDAHAAHASELVPGKVLFLTNRAVGRVLDVRSHGDDLVVAVGPVDLTEIIRDGDIRITQMPIDFGEAIAYETPDFPGEFVSLAQVPRTPTLVPAVWDPNSGGTFYRVQATQSVPDVSNLLAKNFKMTPVASLSGIGVRVSADGDGLKVSAESVIHLDAPKLDAHLRFASGRVVEATLDLAGAAGLGWKFFLGAEDGRKANVHGLLQPDVDLVIPVGGIGPVPLAITVRQRFEVNTGFGARNSTLSASGDYTFTGGFSVGYANKTWGVAGPVDLRSTQSMARTGEGVSMAINGLNLANQIRIIVGVGVAGFAAGPYFRFTSAVGAFRNSDIGMLACNTATLDIKLAGGVGYVIPKSVTDLVNSVLSALNVSFRIKGEGGLEPSSPLTIINKSSAEGGCNVGDKSKEVGEMKGPV